MPRLDYKWCKRCGRHTDECGQLSHTRLCLPCARTRMAENNLALAAHAGAPFTFWRRRIAASVGGVLLDDTRQ